MQQEMELEVFRAGDYGAKGRWSESELDEIARSYRAELHEAPVTIDHAQTGPALGWVDSVKRRGDRLVARLHGLNAAFVELLNHGAFKKRSVELYRRLPETGGPYLKAVSFLGAGAPAVKGLRDVLHAEGVAATAFREDTGEAVAIEFGEGFAEESGTDAGSMEPGERPGSACIREQFDEMRDALREAGRWLPLWERRGIEEFHAALASLDEIEVSGEASIKPAEWFAGFLKSLAPAVPMGEAAGGAVARSSDSIPSGERVSGESIARHHRAVAMRASHPHLSYGEALREAARS